MLHFAFSKRIAIYMNLEAWIIPYCYSSSCAAARFLILHVDGQVYRLRAMAAFLDSGFFCLPALFEHNPCRHQAYRLSLLMIQFFLGYLRYAFYNLLWVWFSFSCGAYPENNENPEQEDLLRYKITIGFPWKNAEGAIGNEIVLWLVFR